MINAKQFRSLIVKPVLQALDFWSQEAENLLVMIMSWESKGGTYLKQEKGPAIGPYMMESATHYSLWHDFLHKEDDKIKKNILDLSTIKYTEREFEEAAPHAGRMIFDYYYATAMARIFFLRIKEPIPLGLHELAAYAKKYWNTEKGKATPEDYYGAYCRFESIAL